MASQQTAKLRLVYPFPAGQDTVSKILGRVHAQDIGKLIVPGAVVRARLEARMSPEGLDLLIDRFPGKMEMIDRFAAILFERPTKLLFERPAFPCFLYNFSHQQKGRNFQPKTGSRLMQKTPKHRLLRPTGGVWEKC